MGRFDKKGAKAKPISKKKKEPETFDECMEGELEYYLKKKN